VASFHGIILAAGRALFEFGRVGHAPKMLGTTLAKRKTPAAALIVNMLVGILALTTGRTGDIITLSVFGALTLYVISMLSLFRLRRDRPDLKRPFRTPFFPATPLIALVLATLCLVAMCTVYIELFVLYLLILGTGIAYYRLITRNSHARHNSLELDRR
jgi:ethanolamine permease